MTRKGIYQAKEKQNTHYTHCDYGTQGTPQEIPCKKQRGSERNESTECKMIRRSDIGEKCKQTYYKQTECNSANRHRHQASRHHRGKDRKTIPNSRAFSEGITWEGKVIDNHMGVSKKRGTQKLMETLLKWMIWGYPYFGKHPYGKIIQGIRHSNPLGAKWEETSGQSSKASRRHPGNKSIQPRLAKQWK